LVRKGKDMKEKIKIPKGSRREKPKTGRGFIGSSSVVKELSVTPWQGKKDKSYWRMTRKRRDRSSEHKCGKERENKIAEFILRS